MTFDPQQFKQAFPLFAQAENQRLVYLDNAATTQRPQCVLDAIIHFYTHSNANTHRSSHRLARAATEMVEAVRVKLAAFVHAADAREMIYTRGATEALNLLASSIGQTLQDDDEIILSAAEHHANLVPWQMLAQRKKIKLRFLPVDSLGRPDITQLPVLLNERTRLLSITAASNVLGCRTDLEAFGEILAQHPCQWLLDASQLLAHEAVDVQALGCDYLVGSAHKFYGPTGIGFIYGRAAALAALPPWQGGGEMITRVTLEGSEFAALPHRFEAGTSALASIAGLGAALDFLQGFDRVAIHKHESELLKYLHSELEKIPHLRLLSQPEGNLGLAVFVPSDNCAWSALDIAHWLDEQDIAVRVGQHCAQPLVAQLGVPSALRVSLAGYSTAENIERLLNALRHLPLDVAEVGTAALSASSTDSEDIFDCAVLDGLGLSELADQGWQQRYRRLMKWGDKLPEQPALRRAENLVQGCESAAWLKHRCVNGYHEFAIDSEARVVRGLSVLLLLLVQGRRSEDISRTELQQTFAGYGLDKHLSVSRSNGFAALVDAALRAVEATDNRPEGAL